MHRVRRDDFVLKLVISLGRKFLLCIGKQNKVFCTAEDEGSGLGHWVCAWDYVLCSSRRPEHLVKVVVFANLYWWSELFKNLDMHRKSNINMLILVMDGGSVCIPMPHAQEARSQAFSAVRRFLASSACVWVLVEDFHVTLGAGDFNIRPHRWGLWNLVAMLCSTSNRTGLRSFMRWKAPSAKPWNKTCCWVDVVGMATFKQLRASLCCAVWARGPLSAGIGSHWDFSPCTVLVCF